MTLWTSMLREWKKENNTSVIQEHVVLFLFFQLWFSHAVMECFCLSEQSKYKFNPYPTAFPYGNGMVLHFYQQQEISTTKTVHKVINTGL